MTRLQRWTITETGEGVYSVARGGRSMADGLAELANASAIVAQHHRPGEKVLLVENDGYYTDITPRFLTGATPGRVDHRIPVTVHRSALAKYLDRYGIRVRPASPDSTAKK